ncbi:hypothetical protein BFW38_05245 [Terasakiispira papahanaumokuakeensis]|uniref:Uncharacterized protein n=1 Tax=Terasakiispira papahanaumokuakeensis TaxID=197479 RepID=A0A1E2V7P9_9GAMM|nr:RHS repeat-associated core domain-containing protein [Terasakiispira papahanaumokuakeensis]ODC03040.1 hypothetical protein BFW38_05245 [Terasakiispira papahanaumokuakeensis]
MTTALNDNTTANVPPELREQAIHQRVMNATPYDKISTPPVDIQTEPEGNTVLDVVIQAAYMVPVVGNVMAIGDVARDIVNLTENDRQGNPNVENPWLWAIMVIDAIGIIPAAGNASRPIRVAAREAFLAFARGEGIAIAADILWAEAGGDAIAFMEKFQSWLQSQQSTIQNFINSVISGIKGLVKDPVEGAIQVGLIEANPSWWEIDEHGKRIVLKAFDELVEWLGDDTRDELVSALDDLGVSANQMVAEGFNLLLPVAAALAAALIERRSRRRGVDHQAMVNTGAPNHSRRGAVVPRSTHDNTSRPSDVPAGCTTCGINAPQTHTAHPIDYVMGDENLWQTDFSVPGRLTVEWTRLYRSSTDQLDDSELGARWSSPYHIRLEQHLTQLYFIDPQNRAVPLVPLAIGQTYVEPREHFTLSRPDEQHYRITYLDGSYDDFQLIPESATFRPDDPTVHFRLVRQQEVDGRALTLRYQQGCLHEISDGAGLLLRCHYTAASSAPAPSAQGATPQSLLSYIERHFPETDQAPEVLARYHYDGQGDLIRHEDARSYSREYTYQHHLLTRYTDFNGMGVSLTWDWPNKTTVPDAVPNARSARCVRNRVDDGSDDTTFEYHRDLWYTRVTDAEGVVRIYRYNAQNRIESITYPYDDRLGTERWQWDRQGNLRAHIDGEGRTTYYDYDDAGRLTAITDPASLTTRIEYNEQGLPTTLTDPQGRQHTTAYDQRGLPTEATDPSGRTTQYQHDEQGQLIAMTDPQGNTYQYQWNALGQLISASDCSRKVTRYAYDHRGFLACVTDASGQLTQYERDALGLPLAIHHPDGAIERFRHDGERQLVDYTDPAGHHTRYRYNGVQLPIERQDPMGHRFQYRYDRLNRLVGLINQNGDQWQFHYDGAGQLVEESGFDGRTTRYVHDGVGWVSEIQQGDRLVRFERDPLGQPITRRSLRPGMPEQITHYAYDVLGRLVAARAPGSETRFDYDDQDNLIAETQRLQLPNGAHWASVTRHTHDALGNRETTTLPDGREIAWLRYGSGHVQGMALDGDSLISFERDDLHRAVTRHQQGQQTQLRYDPVGRLLAQEVFQAGPETHHNRPGQRQTLSRRPTIKRQYQYTVNGLLSQVQDQQRGPTQYQYDPLGRLREALAPGQAERFDFDPASNLIDPQDAASSDTHTRATEWRADLSITGQPTQSGHRNGPTVMGNLLKRFADTRYHYDAHGNLTRSITVGGSTWEYRYDAEHRMVEACQYAQAPAAGDTATPHTKAQYGYDALGRRLWKQVEIDGQAPELTVFTWDGDLLQSETRFEGDTHQPVRCRVPGLIPDNPRRKFPRPIAQQVHTLDASPLVPTHTATYLYEPDSFIPLAQLTAGFDRTALAATGTDQRQPLRCYQAQTATLYYFQTDHLGTPQDITDTEGHIVWSGQYRAWGQLAQAHNGQGDKTHVHNPFRFQGQYHDRETGLHYNRFRYYDPRIGRFTTQDPIGLMGGDNLYQYAPNPTGWVDPLGLSKQCCGGGDNARAMKNARQRGVNRAKSAERDLVQSGHPGTADDGGWSFAERKRIAETGQFPSDTRWHHINDVKNNPDLADVADNIVPSRGNNIGHVRKYHPAGTRSGSSGSMLNRFQLKEEHMNGN